MEYLSHRQTAETRGISGRHIQRLCVAGRIQGAVKIGCHRAVAADVAKPKDQRIISRKYIKVNN